MKTRILLIDDNKHLRTTLTDHLGHEGFDVAEAESGEAALANIEQVRPDLIVLDINMPGMGGVGFLRRILNEDGRPKYPVLVLTARATMESFFEAVPVDGFIAKPCPMADLLAKIREILRARPRSPEAGEVVTHTVLIGEDDPSVLESLVHFLRDAGFVTTAASTGPELVEKAPVVRPSLVLMKQLLPKMNGNVLAPLLAAMPSTRGIPIILYDESRKSEDPQLFASRLPPCVSRYIASNKAADLLRVAREVIATGR